MSEAMRRFESVIRSRWLVAACLLLVGVHPTPATANPGAQEAGASNVIIPEPGVEPGVEPVVESARGALQMRLRGQTAVVSSTPKFAVSVELVGILENREQSEFAVTTYQRVGSRSAFDESVNGIRLGSAIRVQTFPVPPVALAEVPPLAESEVSPIANRQTEATALNFVLELGSCETCVPVNLDGVYPVSVDLRRKIDGSLQVRMITHAIVARQSQQPVIKLGLLVPISIPRTLTTSGERGAADLKELVAVSESLAGSVLPLSVSLTPSIIDHATADAAVAGALDTLNAAMTNRDIIAGTYEDIQPSVQHDGRLGQIVKGQWRLGAETLRRRFGDNVVDDMWVRHADSLLPDRDGLTLLQPQRLIVDGSLVQSTDSPLRTDAPVFFDTGLQFTVEDGLVKPSETLEESTAISTMVTDTWLQDRLNAGAGDERLSVAHFLAELSLTASESQNSGAVVIVPPGARTRRVLDPLFGGLASLPFLRAVRLTELFDRPNATNREGELVSVAGITNPAQSVVPPVGDAFFRQLDETRRRIDGANQLIGTGVLSPNHQRAEQFFAAAISPGVSDPSTFLRAAALQAESTSRLVNLVSSEPFRLTALRGRIPLSITNDTGASVRVHLSVRQNRVRVLNNDEEQDLEVPPGGLPVALEVQTISSGTFNIEVSLTAPNGLLLSKDQYVVRSTGVSGLGVTITLALLVLLFSWWLRTRLVKARSVKAPSVKARSVNGSTLQPTDTAL